MSGFDTHWLALREPADNTARDKQLIEHLAHYLTGQKEPQVIDMGCGTGSTWRALQGNIPASAQWMLLDHDAALLDEAKRRIGMNVNVEFQKFDLNHFTKLHLNPGAVVTASALFDLASENFCNTVVERLAEQKCAFYAALNFDGLVAWSDTHPLDEAMVAAFNRHQQTEKELGIALGPHATSCLKQLLKDQHYDIFERSSPWQLDANSTELQTAFIAGFRQPLLARADLPEEAIDRWLSYRLDSTGKPNSACKVGHTDLIAFPRTS